MQNDAKRTLTPKLRFPEFRAAPHWTEKSLEEVLSPIVRERKKPVDAYTGLGMRSHGKGTFLKNLENPAKNLMEYLYEVQCDDLIVNITFAWEGAIAIARPTDTGALVSHRFPTFIFKRDAAIPDFFRYIILDKQFVYSLGIISPGGAGRNRVLNKNDFLKLRVFLPKVSEQQKIADCLSSLDELIATQELKLESLNAHKKGLMQQLFPNEDETLPRLRFPEFRKALEWKAEPLKTLYTFMRNNVLSRDKLNYESGSVKNIHYGDIHTKFSALFDITKESVPYINATEQLPPADSKDYCFEGDLIFADASEDTNDVGKTIELVRLNSERLLSGQHTILARRNNDSLIVGFGGHLFRSRRIRSQIQKQAQGTKVYAISAARLANIEIIFPGDNEEQQKIADCLSSLDELIAAQTKKLAALKIHKKGLMQLLFPSPEVGV
ncbi:MAG TPA: restriction endonuclease subunit S [Phycisphaerae bacterium]|nr:restriction endonuclease subunit S [Phycisphaerae bacterium]